MDRTKTCGDCIHAVICKQVNGGWFSPKNIAYCKGFEDCTIFVIPVRCKDCKMRCPESVCALEHCTLTGIQVDDDDFCSYGERREGE